MEYMRRYNMAPHLRHDKHHYYHHQHKYRQQQQQQKMNYLPQMRHQYHLHHKLQQEQQRQKQLQQYKNTTLSIMQQQQQQQQQQIINELDIGKNQKKRQKIQQMKNQKFQKNYHHPNAENVEYDYYYYYYDDDDDGDDDNDDDDEGNGDTINNHMNSKKTFMIHKQQQQQQHHQQQKYKRQPHQRYFDSDSLYSRPITSTATSTMWLKAFQHNAKDIKQQQQHQKTFKNKQQHHQHPQILNADDDVGSDGKNGNNDDNNKNLYSEDDSNGLQRRYSLPLNAIEEKDRELLKKRHNEKNEDNDAKNDNERMATLTDAGAHVNADVDDTLSAIEYKSDGFYETNERQFNGRNEKPNVYNDDDDDNDDEYNYDYNYDEMMNSTQQQMKRQQLNNNNQNTKFPVKRYTNPFRALYRHIKALEHRNSVATNGRSLQPSQSNSDTLNLFTKSLKNYVDDNVDDDYVDDNEKAKGSISSNTKNSNRNIDGDNSDDDASNNSQVTLKIDEMHVDTVSNDGNTDNDENNNRYHNSEKIGNFSDEKWNKIEHEHYRKQLQHQRDMNALLLRHDSTIMKSNNNQSQNNNQLSDNNNMDYPESTKRQILKNNNSTKDNIYSRYYAPGTVTRLKEEEVGSPNAVLEARRAHALKQRQKKALANAHHRRVIGEVTCRRPQPRVERIRRDPWKIYTPHCTILHRCADDTGCCPSERQTCAPKRTKNVDLYFFVISLNETQGNIERLTFINHTECYCMEKAKHRAPEYAIEQEQQQKQQQHRSMGSWNGDETSFLRHNTILNCNCPNLYEKILQEDDYCRCDCSSGNTGCDWLKRGMEHFSMNDRKCISEERCKLPTCEYGAYIKKHGRCPRREERQMSGDINW